MKLGCLQCQQLTYQSCHGDAENLGFSKSFKTSPNSLLSTPVCTQKHSNIKAVCWYSGGATLPHPANPPHADAFLGWK